jgi:hypothetical protein
VSAPVMKPWPKLSVDLPFPRRWDACQGCGSREDLLRWLEHDDDDWPRPVVVVLCRSCSDRHIEPHPRLYAPLDPNMPVPGVMAVCKGCRHQDGLACTNPTARVNGGRGLEYEQPRPIISHVTYQTRHGRRGRWKTEFPGPVTACSGREEV